MQGTSSSAGANFARRNIKRLLEYWGPITVTLSLLGTGIGVITLYVFTRAIGRVDLFMFAIDAKTALAIWVLIIILISTLYLISLTMTTWFYGVAVSMFGKIPNKLGMVAAWLLLPIWGGFGFFIVLIFYCSDYLNASASLAIVCAATTFTYALLFLSKGFQRLLKDNTVGMTDGEVAYLLIFQCLTVCFTVVLSAIPASIILNSYVGEDTSEAIAFVAILTFATLALSLAPTLIFYISKGAVYSRATYGFVAALLLLFLFLLLSRGTMSTITYAAAKGLQVRETATARYILADDMNLSDFDNLQWRTRLHESKRVEVQAFSLFSFGDVLLLCPSDYIRLGLHDLPRFSEYCFRTQNSKVIRKPVRPNYAPKSRTTTFWAQHMNNLARSAGFTSISRSSTACHGELANTGRKLLMNTSCLRIRPK
ncbi:hypothetical protein [Pseudomonas sp. PA1(2017)]|uniref:hypothetical protein n=1 Tax=Pseudomonas sp. PA1(2017) TaxID=1932113 RepID=UPI0011150E2A|nr:hypothetical protein [Pseudomonas sp. PA1(2017)]